MPTAPPDTGCEFLDKEARVGGPVADSLRRAPRLGRRRWPRSQPEYHHRCRAVRQVLDEGTITAKTDRGVNDSAIAKQASSLTPVRQNNWYT